MMENGCLFMRQPGAKGAKLRSDDMGHSVAMTCFHTTWLHVAD